MLQYVPTEYWYDEENKQYNNIKESAKSSLFFVSISYIATPKLGHPFIAVIL
jgi:hypothetical protein